MTRFETLYARLPPAAQSAALTLYGLRLNADRRSGAYRKACVRLIELEHASADELQATEDALLRQMITHAAEHVPHYRRHFRAAGIDPRSIRSRSDLAQLPILEKDDLRAAGPDLVSDATPARRLRHFSSGGTTGTSVELAVDVGCLQLGYAVFHTYQWGWAGIRFGEPWVMINGRAVVPVGRQDPPYWRYNRAANEHFFSCFHIRDETIPDYLREMQRIDPAMLHVYPSNAERLARFMQDHELTGAVRPRAIISTSETLFEPTRRLVEQQFDTKVFNHYTGDYALQVCECEHGGLHIAPMYGLVELVPIPDATVPGLCEMVVTSLANRGTVLLRYRIGDTALPETAPCPCGRLLPRLRSLSGRTGDVIHTPEGSMINASNLTDVFKHTPNIRRCQFVQREAVALTARMEVLPGFDQTDRERFVGEVQSRVGPAMRIDVEIVDEIPLTEHGKFRFVVSEL